MKHILALGVSLAALGLGAGAAFADCGITAGSVRILSNDFEALRLINDTAAECATDAVTVTANATAEHKNLQVPALSINPAEYTVAVVANTLAVGGGIGVNIDEQTLAALTVRSEIFRR